MAEADSPARTISLGTGVEAVDAAAWDALHDGGNPFVGHAFLSLLEDSGSVGPGTGWQAAPLLVEDAADADTVVVNTCGLSEVTQPGRICLRSRLGRRVDARGG